MIKIVHLITDLDLGGAETMLGRLVSRMDRNRFQNNVISLMEPGPIGEMIQASGIPVCSLRLKRGVPDPRAIFQLSHYLQKEVPDILQTWLYHSDLLGSIVGRLVGIPVILWNIRCSEMDMSQYSVLSKMIRGLLGKISSLPRAVIVNSEAGRQYHETLGYRPRQWRVIANGIDLAQFHPDPEARTRLRKELNLSPNALVIGLLGRFDPMKDHENFLHAAKHLLRAYPKTHFVLAGRGVTAQNTKLFQARRKLEVMENTHLMGERRDVQMLLAGMDILTSASAFGEGFPNIIGEGMACGIPCVVTDVGDSARIVSETGRVVKPRDPKALAGAWEELIRLGEGGRQLLGKTARQRIQEHFDLSKIVGQYEKFYENLIQGKERDL
ncbi:MAG: glycosyltransferase [Nitrospirales bacterium]|nr:glycosyltransferase [Nitrospirales bacterium]